MATINCDNWYAGEPIGWSAVKVPTINCDNWVEGSPIAEMGYTAPAGGGKSLLDGFESPLLTGVLLR